jgi:hypothetical protein
MADQPHLLDNGGRMSASTCAKCHRFGPLCDCPPAKPEPCPQCRKPWDGRECEPCGYRREADVVEPRAAGREWTLEAHKWPDGTYSARPYIYDPNAPDDNRYVCELTAEYLERSGSYKVTPLSMERAAAIVRDHNAAPKLTEALWAARDALVDPNRGPSSNGPAIAAIDAALKEVS